MQDLKVYVYESPDGGETVYQRPFNGDPASRTLVYESMQANWNRRRAIWHDIFRDAPNDPTLMEMLEKVETYYRLKRAP